MKLTQDKAFDLLAARLEHARKEHPVFADSDSEAARVIMDETRELREAVVFNEGKSRVLDEALDVAATAMRLVMREHEG